MKPAILVALLFRTLDAFRLFDSVFIQTLGANDTEVVSILGYNVLINRLNLGLGSAISVLIFICRDPDRALLREGARNQHRPAEGRGLGDGTHRSREGALVDRDPGGPALRAHPGGVDRLAVAQGAGGHRGQEVPAPRTGSRSTTTRRSSQRGHLQRGARELDRDRGHRHADLDRARGDGGLRHVAARLLGQDADPHRRARGGDVPADLDRRLAVRHVAGHRPVRHLARD